MLSRTSSRAARPSQPQAGVANRCQWALLAADSQSNTVRPTLPSHATSPAQTTRTSTTTATSSTATDANSASAGGGPRHHSVSDFGGGDSRTYSPSNLQSFYATQRHSHGGNSAHGQHQPSRASEAEQVMQAKRRMAAQRERELRNYHQEQQYNRSRPPSSE